MLNTEWNPASESSPERYLSVIVWGKLIGDINYDCHEAFIDSDGMWCSVRKCEPRQFAVLTHWKYFGPGPNGEGSLSPEVLMAWLADQHCKLVRGRLGDNGKQVWVVQNEHDEDLAEGYSPCEAIGAAMRKFEGHA